MEPGHILGPYRIVKPLGAGGMGEVYQAEDGRLDRMVAIKILPVGVAGDADRLERFEREAKVVAALEHPNVVTIHSVEEIEGVRFLTMELVRGRTLAQVLHSAAGALSVQRFFDLAAPLSEGLAAAHAAGVVHRDLKPANVMVTDEGRVKILDFGLAKLRRDMRDPAASRMPTEAITEEGRVLGTVPYMSPEQVKGESVDERSDVFSLGVILYETATGVRPFRGESPAEVGSSIIRDTPASVTDLNRELPEHLGRIVRRCLEKDPRRRYPSAAEAHADLAALAREAEVTATGSAAGLLPERGLWRRAAVSGAAVVVVALLGWFAWQAIGAAPSTGPAQTSTIRSIAVLPFEAAGVTADEDFFVGGMQDALITELSKTDLRVIAQSSASRFQGTGMSFREIAAELGVAGLVEGSVLRVGDRVRVTARLVHGPSDDYVWADSYDRDLSDVLVLTSELARAIAGHVQLAITPEQDRRLALSRRVDPAAWELYARGMYHAKRFSGDDFVEARRLFREAIDIDPEFADAWAGLGLAYGVPASTGGVPDPELVENAWRALDRALELDPNNADALGAMGHGRYALDWDWDAAEAALVRALELKPNSSIARHGYADLLAAQGRLGESAEQTRLGRQYDPLSPYASGPHIAHLVLARRFEEAIEEQRRARARIPELSGRRSWLADALWGLGRYDEAVEEYAANWRDGGQVEVAELVAGTFEAAGPQAAARARADWGAQAAGPRAGGLDVATWYARAGEAQAALDWLERAYELRVPMLPTLIRRFEFDFLRSEARYASLMDRLGLPG